MKPLCNDVAVGIICIWINLFSFQLANILMKQISLKFNSTGSENFFYASLFFCMLSMFLPFFQKRDLLDIEPAQRTSLGLRVFFTGMSGTLRYLAFQFTSYSKVMCIFLMVNFFIPIFCFLILGQKMMKWDILAMLLAIVGMGLIVQPFRQDHSMNNSFMLDLFGCFLSFLSCIFASLGVTFLQKLAKSGVHFSIMTFYFGLGGLISSPLLSFLIPRIQFPHYSFEYFGFLSLSALFLYSTVSSFAFAQKSLSGVTVGLAGFASLPLSVIFDILFFKHQPEALEIIGMTFILVVNLVTSVLKIKGTLK